MSLFEKIWEMSLLGLATQPGATIYQHFCVNSFIRWFFSVKLAAIGASKEREFMVKGILKLLGSFQGSEFGATRRGRIKTKEARGHGEKPSRNCLLLGILNA